MKPGHLALHIKGRRLLTVVRVKGRIIWCAWFPDGEDPKKPDAKLQHAPFWAHHLSFDAAAIRARATELGLDQPAEPVPDEGSGNA